MRASSSGRGFSGRRSFAKSLGSFVPKLTGKAFEKYGFSTVMLLTEWRSIVGPELAAYSMPERLKWPRNVDTYGETPAGEQGRPGATLLLRVDGPRAIEAQYQSSQIIERINRYFGYQAVTALRFIQAPVAVETSAPDNRRALCPAQDQPTRTAARPSDTASTSDASGDPGLLAALNRLERSVLGDTGEQITQHRAV